MDAHIYIQIESSFILYRLGLHGFMSVIFTAITLEEQLAEVTTSKEMAEQDKVFGLKDATF